MEKKTIKPIKVAYFEVKVYNVPDGYEEYDYLVVRLCDGELWYYAGFNGLNRAIVCSDEINGIILGDYK